jgi:hypothetical protein
VGGLSPVVIALALLCVLLSAAVILLWIFRRPGRRVVPVAPRVVTVAPPPPLPPALAGARRTGSMSEGRRGGAGLTEVATASATGAMASSGPMVCPTCRREYEAGLRHCPYDARKLMPAGEVRQRHAGSICPRCRRGFDAGTKSCPHDRTDLVALAVWEAVRGRRRDAAPMGVLGKVCPSCGTRHDLAELFCRGDGTELRTVN